MSFLHSSLEPPSSLHLSPKLSRSLSPLDPGAVSDHLELRYTPQSESAELLSCQPGLESSIPLSLSLRLFATLSSQEPQSSLRPFLGHPSFLCLNMNQPISSALAWSLSAHSAPTCSRRAPAPSLPEAAHILSSEPRATELPVV